MSPDQMQGYATEDCLSEKKTNAVPRGAAIGCAGLANAETLERTPPDLEVICNRLADLLERMDIARSRLLTTNNKLFGVQVENGKEKDCGNKPANAVVRVKDLIETSHHIMSKLDAEIERQNNLV